MIVDLYKARAAEKHRGLRSSVNLAVALAGAALGISALSLTAALTALVLWWKG
ncbi:MAG TPA: hypothetical protein VG273_28910 [Bryobacteraceae bacterium]|nr:hypothetical protein [Bryobacteraceae bacterium]